MEIYISDDSCFSSRSRAIRDARLKATDGGIDRVLGKGKRFAPGFKRMARGDHEGILQLPYLRHDLEALRRILNALDRDPRHAGADDLIKMFKDNPSVNGYDSILCPIARQVRCLDLQTGAIRYFYPEVRGQLSLVTIIMGFAESLDALEIKLAEARSSMDQIAKVVTKAGRGLVAFGAFEPDLRSESELNERRDLARAKAELGWDVDLMSDEEWAFFAPFVIETGAKRGRPPKDHRQVLDYEFWIARTVSAWLDLPDSFGPWASVYRQFRRWALAGVWDLILEALIEADGPPARVLLAQKRPR